MRWRSSRSQKILADKRAAREYDVFLCHNSVDKPAVKVIGKQLAGRGLLPWLDEWELRPGLSWRSLLEEAITRIKAAAVFVGTSGMGPWQDAELNLLLDAFVTRRCPVIPVILGDVPTPPALPSFLKANSWVDFCRADSAPLERLVWGITGERPDW